MVRIAQIAHHYLNSRSINPLGGRFLRSTSGPKCAAAQATVRFSLEIRSSHVILFHGVDLQSLVNVMQNKVVWALTTFNKEVGEMVSIGW